MDVMYGDTFPGNIDYNKGEPICIKAVAEKQSALTRHHCGPFYCSKLYENGDLLLRCNYGFLFNANLS